MYNLAIALMQKGYQVYRTGEYILVCEFYLLGLEEIKKAADFSGLDWGGFSLELRTHIVC